MTRPVKKFTWTNYIIRLGAAVVLVFATYNPSGWSYYHWVSQSEGFDVYIALGGVVLLIGWAIFLRATTRSLGAFGTLLAILFFGLLIWAVIDLFDIPSDDLNLLIYLFLIGLAGVLSAGISWSHIRRRMTGQLDVDEADV
ncbi:MAG: DUF6524 family protein [Arenicellales bacterium]|nr:DUF6524 family protein [Arenicellales bacterium]